LNGIHIQMASKSKKIIFWNIIEETIILPHTKGKSCVYILMT